MLYIGLSAYPPRHPSSAGFGFAPWTPGPLYLGYTYPAGCQYYPSNPGSRNGVAVASPRCLWRRVNPRLDPRS